MRWSVVIPVKRLVLAKSRLGRTDQPALALAFARDTVSAVVATPAVGRTFVVTDDEDVGAAVAGLGAVVLPDVQPGGLNEAIRVGASYAVGIAGPHPVAALPSDLPALTADALGQALAAAAEHPRAFVPDVGGIGTTLLTATTGVLRPRFGPDSAREHARDETISLRGDWPGLRCDVDTSEDLLAASLLGLGQNTQRVLAMTAGAGIRSRSSHPRHATAADSSGSGTWTGRPDFFGSAGA